MKRTTIRLDDQLLADAKSLAVRTERTLTKVIEDALRETMARGSGSQGRRSVKLTTFKGTGVMPGVDLDDSAGLLDIMEGRAPS